MAAEIICLFLIPLSSGLYHSIPLGQSTKVSPISVPSQLIYIHANKSLLA